MRIAWPSAIASAALAAVLIGILVLFQIPVAKSATTPQPAEPAPKGHAAGHGPRPGQGSWCNLDEGESRSSAAR